MEYTQKDKDRFWGKVAFSQAGCWEWLAGKNTGGYGHIQIKGKRVLSHRYAYQEVIGVIPTGLQLDHLCRNRACVNPSHLEPVTRKENILRGVCPAAINHMKTHCKYGHPLIDGNTYKSGLGGVTCRKCSIDRANKWGIANREKVKAAKLRWYYKNRDTIDG